LSSPPAGTSKPYNIIRRDFESIEFYGPVFDFMGELVKYQVNSGEHGNKVVVEVLATE